MYLSKLEIFGFKSFAHKVTFQFNDGITAIIGPNGCGKSNIVDAIRWVLGEQRPSLLRLDKMDNLIFNGTAVRKPLSMVEVSLLIENSKQILPSIYTEVRITRRLYRSGESEYLLNNRQVRLKDIIDLFADTGMGSDAYSVIELKMVEQILSDNAEERRRLFEEAAGIKKYKFRRKSALRKLESTDLELVRLSDVIAEVQKNVNSLSRQVGKSRRYHEFKNELKQKELFIYQLRQQHYQEDLVPLREEFNQVRQTRERLGKEVNQDEAELEKLQVKAVDLENQFREVSSRLATFDNKVREIQQKVQLNEQRIDSFRQNIADREQETVGLEKRLTEIADQLNTVKLEKNSVAAGLVEEDAGYQKKVEILQQLETSLNTLRKKYQQFMENNLQQMQEISGQREEYYKITVEKENIQSATLKLRDIRKHSQEEISSHEQKLNQWEKEFHQAQKDLEVHHKEGESLNSRIRDIERENEALEEEKNQLLGKIEKSSSRRDFLQSLIENYEGFSDSVQFVMGNKKNYGGLIDTLANLVDTQDEYRPALESYLEEIANYLIVDEVDSARNILTEIRREKKGRLTLVPLSHLNMPPDGKLPPGPAEEDIKYFKDLVSFNPRYEKLFHLLFDRVLLVQDIETALKYQKKYPDFKFLTWEGDLLGEWGHITGGNSHQKINLTGRKHQFAEWRDKTGKLEKELSRTEEKIGKNREKSSAFKIQWEKLQNTRDELTRRVSSLEQQAKQEKFEITHLRQRSDELEKELLSHGQRFELLEKLETGLYPSVQEADQRQKSFREEEIRCTKELEEVEQQYRQQSQSTQQQHILLINRQNSEKELTQKMDFLKTSEEETRQRISHLQQDVSAYQQNIQSILQEINLARQELEGLYTQRDVIEKEKMDVENNYQSLKSLILSREEEIKKLHRKWNQSLERLKELELRIQELEIKLRTQNEQMETQFGAELENLLRENPIPEYLDSQQLQEEIARLRQSLESLGEVNPLAVKDYEREKERLDFLKTQQSDLLEAKKELMDTIDKLNTTARALFVETFEKINQNFRSVFNKFFEGGQAELVLIDNDDPLESNIDITVHIKGRRLTTLNLLSAGEKTLTAISLLFAIYLYKPSPFCILDEVDAPLDDVNISRYTHALKEFSSNTQFILVTHNKMTMQAAQAMYGITMEEPGVSKMVSVRFE